MPPSKTLVSPCLFRAKPTHNNDESKTNMDKLDTEIGQLLDRVKHRKVVSKRVRTVDSEIHVRREHDRAMDYLFRTSPVTHKGLFKATYRRELSYKKPPFIDNTNLNKNLVAWINEYLEKKPSNRVALEHLRDEIAKSIRKNELKLA